MLSQSPAVAVVAVDARGLRCPLPVLRLAREMLANPATDCFELASDDPATGHELAVWCSETDCRMDGADAGVFRVTRR